MEITRDYALQLVRDGKAKITGLTSEGNAWPEEPHLLVVTRYDLQRVDHADAIASDVDRYCN